MVSVKRAENMGVGVGSGMRGSWRSRWGKMRRGSLGLYSRGNTMLLGLVLERSLILTAE